MSEREKKFSEALHLPDMSEAGRQEVLCNMANLALAAALGRLLLQLGEAEQVTLELYLESHRNNENVVEYLLKTYPQLGDLLEEELQSLQQEVIVTLA